MFQLILIAAACLQTAFPVTCFDTPRIEEAHVKEGDFIQSFFGCLQEEVLSVQDDRQLSYFNAMYPGLGVTLHGTQPVCSPAASHEKQGHQLFSDLFAWIQQKRTLAKQNRLVGDKTPHKNLMPTPVGSVHISSQLLSPSTWAAHWECRWPLQISAPLAGVPWTHATHASAAKLHEGSAAWIESNWHTRHPTVHELGQVMSSHVCDEQQGVLDTNMGIRDDAAELAMGDNAGDSSLQDGSDARAAHSIKGDSVEVFADVHCASEMLQTDVVPSVWNIPEARIRSLMFKRQDELLEAVANLIPGASQRAAFRCAPLVAKSF